MNKVIVNVDECKGCGLCVAYCPKHCFIIGKSINKLGYRYTVFASQECTACGICFHVCPELGALTVVKGDAEDAEK